MRLTILLAAALLAVTASPAAANHVAGHKAPNQPPGNLTIEASSELIRFGGSVTLSGKLTGPNADAKAVAVQADPFPFADFATVGTANTDAQGDWTFVHKPTVNTRYRARQGGNESGVVTVNVRPFISLRVSDSTPRRGARVRFFGRLCPEHDGDAIRLQRRTATGAYRTVRTRTLDDSDTEYAGAECSRYSFRVRPRRDGVFRAWFAGDEDHAAGPSRRRRINVS